MVIYQWTQHLELCWGVQNKEGTRLKHRFLAWLLSFVFLFSVLAPSATVLAAPAPSDFVSEEDRAEYVVKPDGEVGITWFDTAFDIVSFAMSVAEFNEDPNFWTGIQVVFDGASVLVPGLPSVGAIKGGVNAVKTLLDSSTTLRTAVELGGIKNYWKLRLKRMPAGWERHHIVEGRFLPRLGGNYWSAPAIPIPKADHQLITNKMRAKVPYGTDYSKMGVREILDHHIDAYDELLGETDDRYWEVLRDYVTEIKHRVPDDIE